MKPLFHNILTTSRLISWLLQPLLVCVLIINDPSANALDIHGKPQEFCYSFKSCWTDTWKGKCTKGKHQSPVNIHLSEEAKTHKQQADLHLNNFRTDHFFMQNNGHTINLDFTPVDDHAYLFPGSGLLSTRYRFANAHFHWGRNDSVGSEHHVDGVSYSMELHLVHYNEKYSTMAEAVLSGDQNALAVVAILFKANPQTPPNLALAPIIKNLPSIHSQHFWWIKVESPLDLRPLMPQKSSFLFGYKGSLTTPGCNEQVDWFVFEKPMNIASSDAKAFRNVVDGKGWFMDENHRPIQPMHGRKIEFYELNLLN